VHDSRKKGDTGVNDQTNRLFHGLEKHFRPATAPVGVRLVNEGETPQPAKIKYPLEHVGNKLALCQGMTLARTFGWTMGFRSEDHACPLPRVFMGHIDPGKLLAGTLAGYYQDDPDCMEKMEASYPRWSAGTYREIWLAPLDRCQYIPDLIVVYGNPAQVLTLIQAANFRLGPGIHSTSSGRYGCSTWVAGALQAGQCTYMVPGPGERVFAGTQDHEMSFAVPYSRIDHLVEGLEHIRAKGAFRYPVPIMGLLSEPKIPARYHEIEPE
jgi:uncharacterized protein (DUF169 family)